MIEDVATLAHVVALRDNGSVVLLIEHGTCITLTKIRVAAMRSGKPDGSVGMLNRS